MEKILAKVGALTVTESEVNEFLAGLGPRGASYNTPEGRRVILEQLIGNKLLLQDARRNLLEGEAEFRAELARLKEKLLISYAANKVVSGVKVTEAEVKKYYDENQDKLTSDESVNASHILVATKEEADKILADIKSGAVSFEDAAREHSTCPSGKSGGNLGDFGRGQMVPEFDSAVFSMTEGEISNEPVKTQFGYHIIKLNAKNEPKPAEFDAVKGELTEMLLAERRQAAYESKINQLKIVYPTDILV
ncbi:MAG: peptidylprolyl isomerase [Clostridia bacterium]|nr:peptidylprolyl isomerase [Clostridia bacterium]